MTSLINDLGGSAGFGEFSLPRNDDGSTSFIDLTPIFGAQGVNYFGHYYTGFWLNNNGSVTFNAATSSFTPSSITGSTSNPIIAAFWADVDTRGGAVTATPGGTSTGSNLLWYDLDAVTHTFTATWDDVGYYGAHTNKLNAFQLSIHEINAQGDFDIIFRYESIDWTTGDASGGSNGLGGTPARAGYSAGNGTDYFELPQSGNQAALLALESSSNVGTPGTFVFSVRNGVPTVGVTAGDASADEGNGGEGDVRTVDITVYLTEASASAVTVQYATSDGTARAGQDYVAQSGTLTFAAGVTQQTIRVVVLGDAAVEGDESFTVTLSNASEGASILDGTATGTIVDDDASLSIAAASADAAEGDSGSTAFTFTVTRTGDTTRPATADWAVSGPAVNGADFAGGTLPSGTVTLGIGETSRTITLHVAGDTQLEGDESFIVTLSNPGPGTVIGTASATGSIRNDDFAPASLSIAAESAGTQEGQSGSTGFIFTVTRNGDLASAASASWAVGGAGVTGADFAGGALPSGVVNFAAGESSKVIVIDVAGDTAVESDESFSVTLSNPSTGAIIGTASASGVIRNDDASLAIAATSADKAEGQSGDTAFTFTVTRTGDLGAAASAHWAVGGEGVSGADFAGGEPPSGVVSFAAGESSKVITVEVAGDTAVEADESFSVTLSNPSTGAIIGTASASGVIRNDDASLAIAATSADKAEGQSGDTAFTFTVTRTGDLGAAASAHWAVGGEGVSGADFAGGEPPSGVVSFAAGESSKVITVEVAGDTAVEADESFSVTLSNPSTGAIIGTASANGVIRNDDASLAIAATSADKAEGQSGDTAFTFTVTRTGDLGAAASAHWAVGGEGVSGADFAGGEPPSGVVSFAAGESSKVITVEVAGDTAVEADESFSVTLSNPSTGAIIGTASATGTIRNDDVHPPTLSIAAASADKTEGDFGATPFTFTVTRSGDLSGTSSVHWSVSGDAVTDSDFIPTEDLLPDAASLSFIASTAGVFFPDFSLYGGLMPAGDVSFAAGESAKTITVWGLGETLVEGDQNFTVTLSGASAGTLIEGATAVGTLREDDAAAVGTVFISDVSVTEGDSGTRLATFTVTRSGGTAAFDINYGTSDGTATVANHDYVATSGTLHFADGDDGATFSVVVNGDTTFEVDETFFASLSGATSGALLGGGTGTATILNDDAAPVTVESFGATKLDRLGNQFFLRDAEGAGPALRFQGSPYVDGLFGAWTPIGAEKTANGYQVAWKFGAADQYVVWNLDNGGNYVSDALGAVSGSNMTLQALESTFQQDLNGNGHIGPATVTIESFGATRLDEVGNQFFLRDGAGEGGGGGPALKYLGTGVTEGLFGAWNPIGAEKTAGGYQLAWKFGAADQYVVWNLDNDGNFIGDVTGVVSGTNMSLQVLEPSFQQDLNGNGQIGPTTATIENFGTTRLDEVGNQFFLRDIGGAGPSLKYLGAAYVDGTFGAWAPIAAEQTAGGFQLAWKFGAGDQYVVWNLDSAGNYLGNATGYVAGSDMSLQMLETAFQQDLNGNGHIGPTTTTIENFGATRLDEVGNQFFLRDIGGAGPSLKYLGAIVTEGLFGAWTPIAAEKTAGGYQVAWKFGAADQYVVWNLDGGGNFIGNATGYVGGSDMTLQGLEAAFQQDLNGNGHIGPTTTTIENFGATRLDEVGNQFFLRDGEGGGPALKYLGAAFTEGLFGAWNPIGAERTVDGYQVAWKFGAADQFVLWNLDSGGNFTGDATGVLSGANLALQMREAAFQQDLNGNGHIGPTTTTIENFGATRLDEVGNQFFLHDAEGAGPSLKYLGTAFTEGQFVAWEPIAAEQIAGGYLVAWKNGAADEYVVWSTDSGGNYNGNATGYVAGASLSLQALETTFQQDLNRDGTIYNPPT